MRTKSPPHVWRLDPEGRMSPRARELDWRVIAADRDRVDPTADYVFCAPDFLFPVDSVARALRLEVDPQPIKARKSGRSRRSAAMNSDG
jgi:hypothetical protein